MRREVCRVEGNYKLDLTFWAVYFADHVNMNGPLRGAE